MTVIIPKGELLNRWTQGREAILRRRPLEIFLLSRSGEGYCRSAEHLTTNLVRTCAYFATQGHTVYRHRSTSVAPLSPRQLNILAKIIFSLSTSLARLIEESGYAQLAAALAVDSFITPRHGGAIAARLSVEGMIWCSMRHSGALLDELIVEIGAAACEAVRTNADADVDLVASAIGSRLEAALGGT